MNVTNLRFLEALIWVVRLGSFNAAARQLHVTPAAISSRIAALESDVGRKLLERGARQVQATPAGEILVRFAAQMLDLVRAMRASLSGELIGRSAVDIGVVEAVASTLLLPFLSLMAAEYPGLDVRITVAPSSLLQQMLQSGQLDLTLQDGPVGIDQVQDEHLFRLPVGWFTAVEPISVRPREASPVDMQTMERPVMPVGALFRGLDGQTVLTADHGSPLYVSVMRTLTGSGIEPRRIHCVGSVDVAIRIATTVGGIAVLPVAAVGLHAVGGRLRQITEAPRLPALRIHASYRTNDCLNLSTDIASIARGAAARLHRDGDDLGEHSTAA